MNFIGPGKTQAETLKFLQDKYNDGSERKFSVRESKLFSQIDKIGTIGDVSSIAKL